MKEKKQKLIAIGIDIHGKKIEFDCTDGLECFYKQLISLTVPEGVTHIRCFNNQLTKLTIPMGVKYINCTQNQLTELIIPEGVERVRCWSNQIKELNLPNSVRTLLADKEVMGLDKDIGKVKMHLW